MLKLIPVPNSVQYENGFFHLKKDNLNDNSILKSNIAKDIEQFANGFGVFSFWKNKENLTVSLNEEFENLGEEGYRLKIDENGILIEAYKDNGVFYAVQTLKQIIVQCGEKLPFVSIEDKPRFEFRGFMLDVGRYFYTVDEVKHFLDLMAIHKLNKFHFHLTEDQGWRVEIKKYPLLTEKGSKRSHTNFGCVPRSGYYTQEQIREIVEYAHSKYIKVIPEFDIPGHTVSAIACYPELCCFDRKLEVATHWGVKHDILCAGKESTYKFVYDVLDELAELFPDGEIHLGGDEAVKMRWNICPHCQAEIKKQDLKDSEELQQFFMTKVNAYLNKKGIKTIMWNWDDIKPTKHLDPSITWNLCASTEESLSCIRGEMAAGRDLIVNTTFPYYLDFPYGWVNLKFAYEFNPVKGITEEEMKHIRGVEAPLWTEYVSTVKKAHYMAFPRLGAICENAWSRPEQKDWQWFCDRMDMYYSLLKVYGVEPATIKQAMPSKFVGAFSSLWFNRRMLHWQGVHNLIDDALVKMKYKNTSK